METHWDRLNILVSCVGAYDDSGLGTGGMVMVNGKEQLHLDSLDCTGLYYHQGVYFRFVRSLKSLIGYNEQGIVYRCKFPMIKDCHDIRVSEQGVVFVSTNDNSIYCCDFKGKLLWTKKLPGEGDAWHLNCLEMYKGDLCVAAFGKFDSHRQWNDEGCYEQGILYNLDKDLTIIDGLSGPHHPRYLDGRWYICDSHNSALRVYEEDGSFETIQLGGFTRGFCATDQYLLIGVNANRKKPDAGNARIVVLDRKSLENLGQIDVPYPEIYDLVLCDDGFVKAMETDKKAFDLFEDSEVIDGLKKQVEIGEQANKALRDQLRKSPNKKGILQRIVKRLKRL